MAKQAANVTVETRTQLGSKNSMRLRNAGKLPGVIYGHKEAVLPITMPKVEVSRHLEHGAHLFALNLNGKNENVLVKEVQYDHLGIEVVHVDFARVNLDEKVKVTIPLELKGTPKGVADGAVLQQIVADLDIECLVTDIPDFFRHNVSEMEKDSVLHVKDITFPAGIKVLHDPELIVATVKEVIEQVIAPAVEGPAEPEVIGKKEKEEAAAAAEAAAAGGEKKPAEKK